MGQHRISAQTIFSPTRSYMSLCFFQPKGLKASVEIESLRSISRRAEVRLETSIGLLPSATHQDGCEKSTAPRFLEPTWPPWAKSTTAFGRWEWTYAPFAAARARSPKIRAVSRSASSSSSTRHLERTKSARVRRSGWVARLVLQLLKHGTGLVKQTGERVATSTPSSISLSS